MIGEVIGVAIAIAAIAAALNRNYKRKLLNDAKKKMRQPLPRNQPGSCKFCGNSQHSCKTTRASNGCAQFNEMFNNFI